MDREELVKLFNNFKVTSQYSYAYAIVSEFLKNASIVEKERKIEILLKNPLYGPTAVDYAINQLCLEYKINVLTQNNQIILFI